MSALNGILAQRLVRLNCSRCATPYRPPADLLARSGVDKRAAYTARFRRGLGCTHCAAPDTRVAVRSPRRWR